MALWQTIAPLHGIDLVDLSPNQRFDFADGTTLELLPDWVSQNRLFHLLSRRDLETVLGATHGFIITYEAETLESPDPAWKGLRPGSIQDAKRGLAMLANLALWLSCPSPVGFICVLHAEQAGANPEVKQLRSCSPIICHPKDSDRIPSVEEIAQAQGLHLSIARLQREGSVWTAVQAVLTALQMSADLIRYPLFWIALEALFGPDDAREITYRLSQRIALFLAEDRSKAREIFEQARKGYGFRSKIAHGRWKESPDSMDMLADVETFARESLKRVLLDDDLLKAFSGKSRERYLSR